MCAKRASGSSASAAGGSDPATGNAILLIVAIAAGLGLLVQRGRLSWPPIDLLSSLSIVAGCLALVGPPILARSASSNGSLGELVWLAGGLLVWLFDLSALLQGQARSLNWTTPIGERTMALTILAIFLAGWRCGLRGRDWSWTNVVGWSLGLFWVGLGAGSWLLAPGGILGGLASR
ncbi:MAG: hypothetical protein U0790_10565 [Isosphaeraceae bacterium]